MGDAEILQDAERNAEEPHFLHIHWSRIGMLGTLTSMEIKTHKENEMKLLTELSADIS